VGYPQQSHQKHEPQLLLGLSQESLTSSIQVSEKESSRKGQGVLGRNKHGTKGKRIKGVVTSKQVAGEYLGLAMLYA